MSKVWFMTGCSKGFGWALTKELLNSTQDLVVATARDPRCLGPFLKNFGDRILPLQLDVTKQGDIDAAVKATIDKFKRIDVLVNNAGYGLAGAFEECSMDEIREQFETNVFGLMAVTKAVLSIMRKQRSGKVLNFSSVVGNVASLGLGIYSSTKFAVEGFSQTLAKEIAPFGIKVIIIEPGPFRTDFAGKSVIFTPPLPEYHGTDAGGVRERMKQIHGNQPGDPVKAAKIIIQVTDLKDPPLRLPLGNSAVERIIGKLEDQIKEIRENEALIRSADY